MFQLFLVLFTWSFYLLGRAVAKLGRKAKLANLRKIGHKAKGHPALIPQLSALRSQLSALRSQLSTLSSQLSSLASYLSALSFPL